MLLPKVSFIISILALALGTSLKVTYPSSSKMLDESSLLYATGHIKDPVPLIEKRRGLSPGGRFPPSFIHQVIIIITGLI